MSDSVPWETARQLAQAASQQHVRSLDAAVGGSLVNDLRALTNLPSFDTAAMDGFAVNGPGPWRLTGQLDAGAGVAPSLHTSTCLRIATGAPIPEGCEGVLPWERADVTGELVQGPHPAGANIRDRGQECRPGDVLAAAGTPVTPVIVGIAAASGHDALLVRGTGRVRILVSGDEVVTSGPPGRGQVRDALGPMLLAAVRRVGATAVTVEHVGDLALAAALESAGEDVLLCTGATSHGPRDRLRPGLAQNRAEVLVPGVACRPGHPMLLATLPDGRRVVGVPGNPLAALACFMTLVMPLLSGVIDDLTTSPGFADLPEPHRELTRLVPVSGSPLRPVAHRGAAMLRGAATAAGLAAIRPDGDVRWLPFPWSV